MPGEVKIEGADEFMRSVDALIAAIDVATQKAVRNGISLISRNAKRGFAGQHPLGTPRPIPDDPRPYAVSEDLKRSIKRYPTRPEQIGRGVWRQGVGPTMVYGRRIELGFHGRNPPRRISTRTRRLPRWSRTYDQPGYPYLGPAVKKALPELPDLFIAEWNSVIGKP